MDIEIIEAAYFIGFEPSEDGLAPEALLAEAKEFLMQDINN